MAKKGDQIYYDAFTDCAECACHAARMLADTLEHFDYSAMQLRMDEIHKIEHAADMKKHALTEELLRAFITPIEREDILLLSQNIDEMTDKIEDVLLRLYCNHIQTIRPDALEICQVVIRCCQEAKSLVGELADYKRSKTLHDHIVHINTMEEEADQLFINSMRTLHTTCTDPMEIIVWREIYIYLEKCVDACEHVADTVESVVMKNS